MATQKPQANVVPGPLILANLDSLAFAPKRAMATPNSRTEKSNKNIIIINV